MSGFRTTTLRANAPNTFFCTPFDGNITPEQPTHSSKYPGYSPLHRRKHSGTIYDVRSTYRQDHTLRDPAYHSSKLSTPTTTQWSPPSSISFGCSSPSTPTSSSIYTSPDDDESRCFILHDSLQDTSVGGNEDFGLKCVVVVLLVLLGWMPKAVFGAIGIGAWGVGQIVGCVGGFLLYWIFWAVRIYWIYGWVGGWILGRAMEAYLSSLWVVLDLGSG